MDLRFTPEEQAFREEVRSFIRENLPKPTSASWMKLGDNAPRKEDTVALAAASSIKKGWAGYSPGPRNGVDPGWTRDPEDDLPRRETDGAGPRAAPSFNVTMLGPVLVQFGTDAQKKRFLPRAANLDDWWCQGFSEPGAGSDLASLKHRGEA